MNGWTAAALAGALVVLLVLGWRLTWLATRVDRANGRVERTWAALDAALVRRAQRAVEVTGRPGVDPVTALLVADAAAAALTADLPPVERERAESDLTHVLDLVALDGLDAEHDRALLARRLHSDAVVSAQRLRARRTVRVFRLAGHAAPPRAFEMAEPGLRVAG